MIDLATLADHLERRADGTWAAGPVASVSFPEGGHELCHEVEDASFWFRHRNRIIVELVRRHPPAGTIFDLGGGNGYVALGLEQAGFPTVLVEPGPDGARHARQRGLAHVVNATVEAAGFRPATLPAAGMFDVLEHIERDHEFLIHLHRLLVPRARLYLTVPAFQWLWSDDDDRGGHFRRYTRRRLGDDLGRAGFELEYASYFFRLLPAPIFVMRSLPTRLGRPRPPGVERAQKEHASRGGVLGKALDLALEGEVRAVSRGRTMAVGSSLVAVARRRT